MQRTLEAGRAVMTRRNHVKYETQLAFVANRDGSQRFFPVYCRSRRKVSCRRPSISKWPTSLDSQVTYCNIRY